jgi:hypothetical protein
MRSSIGSEGGKKRRRRGEEENLFWYLLFAPLHWLLNLHHSREPASILEIPLLLASDIGLAFPIYFVNKTLSLKKAIKQTHLKRIKEKQGNTIAVIFGGIFFCRCQNIIHCFG